MAVALPWACVGAADKVRRNEMSSVQNLNPEQFYRSDDMALVTYLKLEGFTPQQVGWLGQTCYWWFRITESLENSIEAFDGGDALVEPGDYSSQFNLTKREFYDSRPDGSQRPRAAVV